MQTPAAEEPYSCIVCGERFRKVVHLKNHLVKHEGDDPFQCHVCPERFGSSRDLRLHTSVHAGEKTFSRSVSNVGELVKTESEEDSDGVAKTESEVEEFGVVKSESNGPVEIVNREQIKKEGEDYGLSKPVSERLSVLSCLHAQKTVCKEEVQQRSPSLEQEDPENLQIKEEPEELLTSQEGKQLQGLEDAGITDSNLTVICIKSDSDQDRTQSSHLPHIQTNTQIAEESSSTQRNVTNSTATLNWTAVKHQTCTNETAEDIKMHPYKCGVCGKGFRVRRVRDLEQHARSHVEKKPFHCVVCNRKFSSVSKVTAHIKEHLGEKLYGCDVCGARFTQNSSLKQHVKTHTRANPFTCGVCGSGFPTDTSLELHMRTHSSDRPHGCGVCGKRFNHKQSLTVHARTHTGEKPYRCSVCEKDYSKKQDLTRHMRVHTGEKPYGCSVCGKRFTQPGNRRIHMMRMHSGERTHGGATCGAGFSLKSHLDHHVGGHAVETSTERAKPEAEAKKHSTSVENVAQSMQP
ncbi:zinc finger protein 135-like [Centroberyx affinis]|uniref:zinc finger protein 135-like n=1 Tax=Centroberyx affinis TaxID=166261 RepID=UPI003A5BAD53